MEPTEVDPILDVVEQSKDTCKANCVPDLHDRAQIIDSNVFGEVGILGSCLSSFIGFCFGKKIAKAYEHLIKSTKFCKPNKSLSKTYI